MLIAPLTLTSFPSKLKMWVPDKIYSSVDKFAFGWSLVIPFP